MSDEAVKYARVADGFGDRVRLVPADGWDRQTPCADWVTRDVVAHLVEWVPGFVSQFAGLETPHLPSPADDPIGAWAALDAQLRAWLADPAIAERTIETPMGTQTLAQAIDRFVTADVLVHTWDLARGAGVDDRLDMTGFEGTVAAMEPMDSALRESGHFGPRVPVADDAGEQDRLLAFMGRDPAWTAP